MVYGAGDSRLGGVSDILLLGIIALQSTILILLVVSTVLLIVGTVSSAAIGIVTGGSSLGTRGAALAARILSGL